MTLSIGSIFEPLNAFFRDRFGTPIESPIAFRFDKFGSSLTEDDFRANPADPNSPFSAVVAREKVSDLVNRVPAEVGDGAYVTFGSGSIDSLYLSTLLQPSQPYLSAGTTPDERDQIITAFNLLKADALRLWENSELTSVSGQAVGFHATDAVPVSWYHPGEQAGWATHTFSITQTQTPAVLTAPIVWRTLPSEVRLRKMLQQTPPIAVRSLSAESPVAAGLSPTTERGGPSLDTAGRLALNRPNRVLMLDEMRLRTRMLSLEHRLKFWKQLELEAPSTPVATSNVQVSFEYCVVNLTHRWLNLALLTSPTWKIPGVAQGVLNAAGAPNGLRQLPVGFIALRKLVISADWSDSDRANLNGALKWGPFDVSTTVGSAELAQPGLQIIGWMLLALPPLPPNPPSDGPAAETKPTPTDDPVARTYLVEAGDTLRKIAKHFYGDDKKWRRIQEANSIANPNQIKVGQRLIIPR